MGFSTVIAVVANVLTLVLNNQTNERTLCQLEGFPLVMRVVSYRSVKPHSHAYVPESSSARHFGEHLAHRLI